MRQLTIKYYCSQMGAYAALNGAKDEAIRKSANSGDAYVVRVSPHYCNYIVVNERGAYQYRPLDSDEV